MNALEYLKGQHQELAALFGELEEAGEVAGETRERLSRQLAGALAVHGSLKEWIFYPESKEANTAELVHAALAIDLAVKELVADLLDTQPDDPRFVAKLKVLREQVERHVEEEEGKLFPLVKRNCSDEELAEMGVRLEQLAEELQSQVPTASPIPGRADPAASI